MLYIGNGIIGSVTYLKLEPGYKLTKLEYTNYIIFRIFWPNS